MKGDLAQRLIRHGIRPTPQRLAVAAYALSTSDHPSAERVFARVRRRFPLISRATVYNTLNLFERKGLVRELVLSEGNVVYDPITEPHHHFIDESTGRIYDVPWEALEVNRVEGLRGYKVNAYQVVLRGRKTK